jgi:hypothetical protein
VTAPAKALLLTLCAFGSAFNVTVPVVLIATPVKLMPEALGLVIEMLPEVPLPILLTTIGTSTTTPEPMPLIALPVMFIAPEVESTIESTVL